MYHYDLAPLTEDNYFVVIMTAPMSNPCGLSMPSAGLSAIRDHWPLFAKDGAKVQEIQEKQYKTGIFRRYIIRGTTEMG